MQLLGKDTSSLCLAEGWLIQKWKLLGSARWLVTGFAGCKPIIDSETYCSSRSSSSSWVDWLLGSACWLVARLGGHCGSQKAGGGARSSETYYSSCSSWVDCLLGSACWLVACLGGTRRQRLVAVVYIWLGKTLHLQLSATDLGHSSVSFNSQSAVSHECLWAKRSSNW